MVLCASKNVCLSRRGVNLVHCIPQDSCLCSFEHKIVVFRLCVSLFDSLGELLELPRGF